MRIEAYGTNPVSSSGALNVLFDWIAFRSFPLNSTAPGSGPSITPTPTDMLVSTTIPESRLAVMLTPELQEARRRRKRKDAERINEGFIGSSGHRFIGD